MEIFTRIPDPIRTWRLRSYEIHLNPEISLSPEESLAFRWG